MEKLRFGVLGTGAIVQGRFVRPLLLNKDAAAWGVASGRPERARAFAQKYGFEKAYGSQAELLADPDVDIVYIGTPNHLHYPQAKACLLAGKHVLCEKPFTLNAAQAEELVALAKQRGLLVMEAMWMRTLPLYTQLEKQLRGGGVGDIMTLTACLGFRSDGERIRLPEMGGGALLDLGCYLLHLAHMVFGGEVAGLETAMVPRDTGVDAQGSVVLRYAGGQLANLQFATVANYNNTAVLYGTDGRIELPGFAEGEVMRVTRGSAIAPACHYAPFDSTGFEYEIDAAVRAVRRQACEAPEVPHSATLFVMRQMDEIRRRWGLQYPGEV